VAIYKTVYRTIAIRVCRDPNILFLAPKILSTKLRFTAENVQRSNDRAILTAQPTQETFNHIVPDKLASCFKRNLLSSFQEKARR